MDRRVREIRTHGGMRGEEPRLLSYSTGEFIPSKATYAKD